MARPALSATRGLDIVDFLAAFPTRDFTLSEIVRACDINPASCHAVLHALEERGYVARAPGSKSFRLGPVLVAVGDAALRAQPLVDAARQAAKDLAAELDVPVLLSAIVGDEVVGVLSEGDLRGRKAALRPGERRPLVPPLGASFVAWEGAHTIDAWLERTAHFEVPAFMEGQRRHIETIRQRGYLVALRKPGAPRFAEEIENMAASRSAYREHMFHMVESLEAIPVPYDLDPDSSYDVTLIAAPIFDQGGACRYNLCLGDFARPLDGREVTDHAECLLAACLRVMQAGRQ